MNAAAGIYGISLAAYPWLESYDFRQMVGQPSWFGSYGHGGWAGAGEAIPRIIMHELSHSYWGEYPVEGRPDLSWAAGPDGVAPALSQYHRDLETFLLQPPDRFEPLRDRFRNMPNLSKGDYPDLHHSGEADILSFTGGNIDLLPPLLRKYWSSFLTRYGLMGRRNNADPLVKDWEEAIAWYRGLSETDRSTVEQVFGLQHFPLHRYPISPMPAAALDPGVARAIRNEERQRLLDFAQQFDLIKAREFALVDAAGVNRGFSFWKSYLGDMKELHRAQPDVLAQHPDERARKLGSALDFYTAVERLSPSSQAERYRARSGAPEGRELAVLLKARAVIDLFSATDASQSGVEAIIGHYARKLSDVAKNADAVLAAGRTSPADGARELERYLGTLDESTVRSDTGLTFDLLRDTDSDLTSRILPLMSDAALLRLLRLDPASARAPEIGPDRLLRAAGAVRGAGLDDLAAGALTLSENTSGNFAIDTPYELAVFDIIEEVGLNDPQGAMMVVEQSGVRLDPWLERGSTEMLAIFARAPVRAARLVAGLPSPRTTPYRVVHALTALDPVLAAGLFAEVLKLEGWEDAGPRMFLEFAYDGYWSGLRSGPGVEPALGARFLARLAEFKGAGWLEASYGQAVAIARDWAAGGEVDGDYVSDLRLTLEQAARASSGETAAIMGRLLAR